MLIFYLKKALLLRLAVLFSVIFFTVSSLLAQNSVNTAGKTATGSGGTATYSIGQVVYTTNTGSTGTIAQGVQHAYEIFTTGVEDVEFDIKMSVYPNPSTEQLTLHVSDYLSSKLWWILYDAQGKIIAREDIISTHNTIITNNLPAGNYLLSVKRTDSKTIQTFKIIKN